jgi:flagellar biosynthesis protein FlhG
MYDQATSLRAMAKEARVAPDVENMRKVIAFTSGKGGVGKTNIVANLAISLSKLGKRVVVLDADLGLANIDVLLGLTPKFHLGHLINGSKTLAEVIVEGPSKVRIIPASSGIQELTKLSPEQRTRILGKLQTLTSESDFLFIDTGAGISDNVLYFLTAAAEVIVVCQPEPTSIVDAYAVIKVLVTNDPEKQIKILVNCVEDGAEAQRVFDQISTVALRFLQRKLVLMGYIYKDSSIPMAVKDQSSVVTSFPNSNASRCFQALARQLVTATNQYAHQRNGAIPSQRLFN